MNGKQNSWFYILGYAKINLEEINLSILFVSYYWSYQNNKTKLAISPRPF